MSKESGYFGPGLFQFLKDLKRHNRRDWFVANKHRYERDVEVPMRQFIADLAGRLTSISPRFVADPRRVGGSMFRIYRDTRFSEDKSPYKTWIAARFAHDAGRDGRAVPGFYLSLDPSERVGGGGIYHPDTPALLRIRQRIVGAPKDWAAVLACGLTIEGDTLKRVPIGFDAGHRFADDLKRKDLYALVPFTVRDVCANDFLDRYLDSCEQVAPLVAFLTKALGLRW